MNFKYLLHYQWLRYLLYIDEKQNNNKITCHVGCCSSSKSKKISKTKSKILFSLLKIDF